MWLKFLLGSFFRLPFKSTQALRHRIFFITEHARTFEFTFSAACEKGPRPKTIIDYLGMIVLRNKLPDSVGALIILRFRPKKNTNVVQCRTDLN